MNTILITIKKILFTRHSLIIVLLLITCGALALGYHIYEANRYSALYAQYRAAAGAQQTAAFLPGDVGNPVRDQLNTELSQVLDKSTGAHSRLTLAEQGLATIDTLNSQIDVIGDTAPAVNDAISALSQQAENPLGFAGKGTLEDIVRLATEQMSTIEEIRGLSYRANFETEQIFNRIITDKGALTDAYVIELNNELPKVESEFNDRTNRYDALQANMSRIEADFSSLTTISQPS